MATSFEHRALVEQLKALTSKRAENPGEQILNSSHPSASNSAADDHTQPAVTGQRYSEHNAANKAMYPKGTNSSTKNEEGSEEKDPGNNKGLKVRAAGDLPSVEQKYNLNDHNDPGSSHPSGKAAQQFIAEAQGLAAELRNLIKASGAAPQAPQAPQAPAYNAGAYSAGADEATKLAALKVAAIHDMRAFQDNLKQAAAADAVSFVQTVNSVIESFAAPHVAPAIKQAQEIKQAQDAQLYQAVKAAAVKEAQIKIATYDALAAVDGEPKFAEVMDSLAEISKPKAKGKAPYDSDMEGMEDMGDMEDCGEGSSAEKTSLARTLKKLAAVLEGKSKKAGLSRKGRTFRKSAEEVMDEEAMAEEEEVTDEEDMAAEEALAQMAATPAPAPDAGVPAEGGEAPLSPEEEAALMALIEQEGMKESDVKAYASVATALANGQLNPVKMSQAQKAFIGACDGAVKRAGAKFQTLRSASRLRNELNSIYKGTSL